jgi:hypothetical protein
VISANNRSTKFSQEQEVGVSAARSLRVRDRSSVVRAIRTLTHIRNAMD